MPRNLLRPAVAVAGAAALVGGALLVAGPAAAVQRPVTPLSASVFCISGGDSMECDASATGGVAPYTFHWGQAASGTGSEVDFPCTRNGTVPVSVTATDSVGATATAFKSTRCL
jgi:hypothetical protein